MNARARKALGCAVLLAYLAAYAALAGAAGALLLPILPGWAELVFFAAAGVAWIFPLRPLFAWMNRA